MDSCLVSREVESMIAYYINALMSCSLVSRSYSLQHLIGNFQRSDFFNNQRLITTNSDSKIICLIKELSQDGSFMLFGKVYCYFL